MTVNDLLRERLLSKLNLSPDSVGSINDLLYAYLLDPDSGGGGGGLNDAGVAALVENTESDTRQALDVLYSGGGGGGDSITLANPAPMVATPPEETVIPAYGVKLAFVPLAVPEFESDDPVPISFDTDGASDGDIIFLTMVQSPASPAIDLLADAAPGMVVINPPSAGTASTIAILTYIETPGIWYPLFHPTILSDAGGGVSEDENNALISGSDGKAWLDNDSFSDFVTNSSLASALKYATVSWTLEADEDESDLPSDFPTGPLYPGGPDPLIFRKKAE